MDFVVAITLPAVIGFVVLVFALRPKTSKFVERHHHETKQKLEHSLRA